MVLVVKDIIVIFRKIKTILNVISFKRYFSHLEKSILNFKSTLTLRRHCNSGPWYHKTCKWWDFKSPVVWSRLRPLTVPSKTRKFGVGALIPSPKAVGLERVSPSPSSIPLLLPLQIPCSLVAAKLISNSCAPPPTHTFPDQTQRN